MRAEISGLEATGPTSPLVKGDRAIFHYADSHPQRVSFVGDSSDWKPIAMERSEEGWSCTRIYPEDARDEYMFVVDGQYILDPLNPLSGAGVFGVHSECRMPRYRPPRPIEPPVDGRMERRRLAGRTVDVYVPVHVRDAACLIVQDGSDYVSFTGLPGLLDALIREGAIPPTLAVFVTPRNRDVEYRANDAYVGWLADRLLPSVRARYRVTPSPDSHGLLGASLGGLIATYAACRRPDVFRLVGAQSPAYRVVGDAGAWFQSFGAIAWPELRFHVDGGTFETVLHGKDYLPYIRRGVALLRERGSPVQYNEVVEGHNWTNWRGRLPDLLTWLLGDR